MWAQQLGVSAYDSSGKMRPLKDTFMDLKAALDELNNDQMETQLLTNIFGAMDLKAVNAMLGTSAERFDELSGYISDCTGAAEAMAETMDDNLKGDLTILGSALEGLGIAAYEKFQVPMRTAVQEVTTYIGDLTKSVNDGDLSSSMEKISSGFSELTKSAFEFVGNNLIPAMISGLETVFVLIKTSYGADADTFGCSVKNISTERFEETAKRLERVIIEHKDFEKLITQYDRSDALFYCDPPYHSTERHYSERFSEADHYRLNGVLTALKGRFILSYNDDDFVRKLYKNFSIKAVSRQNNLSSGQFKEIIIKNY